MLLNIFFIVGIISLIVSGILIGAFTNGDQQRANFHTQSEKERNTHTKIGLYAGLLGIISLGIAALIYFM